jgi:excisionase family DNA binding protein
MAGKFLSLEEAAQALGVGVDAIHRLVDRKRLFPLRDGATIKFKADDIERARGDLDDDALSGSGSLELDLDALAGDNPPSSPTAGPLRDSASASASGLELDDLGLEFDPLPAAGADGGDAENAEWVLGSDSAIGTATGAAGGSAADAAPSTGGPLRAGPGSGGPLPGGSLLGDDLALDSLIASSPASDGVSAADAGTEALDLSGAEPGGTLQFPGGSPAAGSQVIGADSVVASLSGSLAVPLDSGVSLEDGELKVSGIDLAAPSGLGLPGDDDAGGGPGSLAGDAFDLGGVEDEESASVVIPTEATGDSSFFENVGDAGSGSFADSSSIGLAAGADAASADLFEAGGGMTFSPWQLAGLIACTLMLFLGGLVMLDLLWTVRSPRPFVSAPLLDALASIFSWR